VSTTREHGRHRQLPRGTFEVSHSGATSGTPKVNPATCLVTFTGTGAIAVGHSAGACRGVSGSGKGVISIAGIRAVPAAGAR
jgi:hypothetical protein